MCHVSLPHLFKSFPHLPLSQEWNMEMCLRKYLDDVSCRRITISSSFHCRTSYSDVLGFCIFFFFLSENRDTPWVMDNIYCGAADANHTCWIFHIQVVVIYLGTVKKSCQYCPLMYPSWGWWYIRGIFYSSVVPYIKGTNSLCPVEH